MKNIIPILFAVALIGFSSCEKNAITTHTVEYKAQCETKGFAFLYMGSDGKMNEVSVDDKSIAVHPMTFHSGDTYVASSASYDLQSQVTISLYIDGVKTTPDETENLVYSYAISGTVGN